MPATVVENAETFVQTPANAIPGLSFPMAASASPNFGDPPSPVSDAKLQAPGFANPYQTPPQLQSNYYRSMPQDYANAKDVTNAWICLVAAIFCFPPITILGIILANRAKLAGNPQAQAPWIANVVYTVLWSLGCLFYMGVFGLALMMGGFN